MGRRPDVWTWEPVDTSRAPVSGDLAKFFKNESVKNPGVMAAQPPSTDATLVAREAIQNSWDAARALQVALGDDAPPFTMRFRFRQVSGEDKLAMVSTLGLAQLRDRADAESRRALGLAESDALNEIDDPDVPLKLLYVEESGTTGMGGPWKADRSKLYLALVAVGFTRKAEGSGGSFGFGKAGLIRGSRLHSVVAHTRFQEQADDPGAVSRALGMTYWGQHRFGDSSWTGFARLGHDAGSEIVPFENGAADELAESLGMPARDDGRHESLGSTFLLPDPSIGAADLVRAIERNWWPALYSKAFKIKVTDYDGVDLQPRPKKDPDLKPFIRGYEIALETQDNRPDHEFKRKLKPYAPRGAQRYELGTVGLVADQATWSYSGSAGADEDGTSVKHESLVALVRSPMMVVEYLSCGSAQPHLRGTFVADPAIDDLLRQTEPKAHDAWERRLEEEGVEAHAPLIAGRVMDQVRAAVRDFRKQIKPAPSRQQDLKLPFLDDLVRSMFESKGTSGAKPPGPSPRPVSIRVEQGIEAVGDSEIRAFAKARLALADAVQATSRLCTVRLRYAFDEDGRIGEECEIEVDPPEGFELLDDDGRGLAFRGDITHEDAAFSLRSAPYSADWSGQLIVTADPVPAATAEAVADA